MKILLENFHANLGKKNIFKPTVGNESLHLGRIENRIVNFATTKNLVIKSTMFPRQNIYKYTWTSPDGKTHNQIDHILRDRKWHASVLNVRSNRRADCGTGHYVVVAKFRERMAVDKQAAQKFDVDRFNFRKLNDLEVRRQYQTEISNRLAALENLNDSEDINGSLGER